MKIKVGTFNCENLFMRYQFFYQKRGKKGDLYNQRFISLSDIPTDRIASFVSASLVDTLYEYNGFLPKEDVIRKDGRKPSKSNLTTLAKKGASKLFSFSIKTIDRIYDEIVSPDTLSSKRGKNIANLLEFRIVSLQIKSELDEIEEKGGLLNSATTNLIYKGFAKNQRWNTAKVFVANDPDIIALQEVENMDALKTFNRRYLYPKNLKKELKTEYGLLNANFRGTYPFGAVLDSNDPRLIDVAILSRYPIMSVKTHQFERFKNGNRWDPLFSRDCLEVVVALEDKSGKSLLADYRGKILAYADDDRILTPSSVGKTVTFFVNHFKSKLGQPKNNPENSKPWKKRKLQSERVVEIIHERFGDSLSGNFIVAGDLNDGPESGAIKPLLDENLWNIVSKDSDPWTHYYDAQDEVEQFDYLLLSNDLKTKNGSAVPRIERRGLAKAKSKHPIINNHARFDTVNKSDTEASDHCAVFAEIEM